MPAPLAKGLIIAASVLVAAGIAIYESPQVRQWVDQSRRKIAVALHTLGDEIQPRRPSECSEDFEARKARREEIIKRNRNELIRQAREEGIAVDLDELAKIGREDLEMAERRQRRKTSDSNRSFDDLVSSDGMLKNNIKKEDSNATTVTGTDSNKGLRRRGIAGFDAGSIAANPFADDQAEVIFDRDDDEAPSPSPFPYIESRGSSATVDGEIVLSPTAGQLIDLTPDSMHLQPENPQTASIPQSEAEDHDQAAQSFYSFASSNSMHNSTGPQIITTANEESNPDNISTGTLTPRSEHSSLTGISNNSVVGSHADDIAVLSLQNDDDHDARSEVFSEGGFTDAGFSEAGFSELGQGEIRLGVMTPSSWTDVGSDDESEWGGPAQGGQVHQVHQ
ncbi:hypothetical protein K469DRAFT_195996 [Zopfia rhizophila CBS 207.26]|uniref:Uncharacterized protein n=1 Tax=Zopfia rhizophila CBS 207.26 TaxID=1314779 RepID=A0A6A6ESM1_9PEZI|nr:hypothetical protein K469DRAFT_195996 [Zopfia rhizophila CBS 207.26]